MKDAKFKIGQQVEWTSSSNGSTTTKRGKVEAVIAAKTYPTPNQRNEADAVGAYRDHESYMVRVPGKTSAAKGKLYWPRVSALKPCNSERINHVQAVSQDELMAHSD